MLGLIGASLRVLLRPRRERLDGAPEAPQKPVVPVNVDLKLSLERAPETRSVRRPLVTPSDNDESRGRCVDVLEA